jgi:hypothetical protein
MIENTPITRDERTEKRMFAKSKNLRDQAQDLAQDLADQVGPRLADAREQLAPHVADARERIRNDVIPTVQSALAEARDQAGPVADEARKRGAAAAAALKGEQSKKGHKGRWLALLALGGAAAVAAKRLMGGDAGSHSRYTPPVPQQRTGPLTGISDDAGGASPEEAIADAGNEPHDATTPADPAEAIHVKRD